MFSAMLELIKNGDIFPLLTKMEFIDENGSVEDILRLSLDIGKKTKMFTMITENLYYLITIIH